MTDITLDPINSGYNLQKINDNFEKIEDNINDTSLQSTGGNNVLAQEIDMNGQRILNLPAPTEPTDVVRLQDLTDGIPVTPPSEGSSGFVVFSDFPGVDPTGITDSRDGIQEAIDFASDNSVELRGEKGTFKILSALNIPKQKGFRWTMPFGCILDSSAATTAFFTIDAYSDRAVGVSSDFTEGLVIDGGRVVPSSIAGSFGIALFYVLNTSSLSNIEVRGGANGILCTKIFYGFFENIKIKDCTTGIGMHIIGLSSDSGFNANPLSGIFITGCKNNLVFDDSEPTSAANAISFSNCTFENSLETSVILNGIRPFKFTTCYFENNYKDNAPAGGSVDIELDNVHLELDNCFINVNGTGHDVTANSVGMPVAGASVRIVDKNTFKKVGVLDNFYTSEGFVSYESDSPNSDFSNPGGEYSLKRNKPNFSARRAVDLDVATMGRTIAPVAGNINNMATVLSSSARAPVTLLEIDLTTAQLRSGWTCTVSAVAYESNSINPTRRGGSVNIHISAFKDGAIFKAYGDIINERVLFASTYGEWFIQDDGVSKVYIGFAPLHNVTPYLQDVQFQVHDMVCRTNGDVVSINVAPAVAMPDPTPTPVAKASTLSQFMSGVINIGVAGASYTVDTSYVGFNMGAVNREVTGELRILPQVDSVGSLKGIPTVSSIRVATSTKAYVWKVRTFASTGFLLLEPFDAITGLLVDVNSFTDLQSISINLDTVGGI